MNDENFLAALAHTLTFEGGYANDPSDRGGETFRGISRKNWPNWPGWPLVDQAKAVVGSGRAAVDGYFSRRPVIDPLVAEFYREHFWKPFERLAASGRVQAKLFDTAVNVGVAAAVKMLQRTLNTLGAVLAADGKIGPKTVEASALAKHRETEILRIFCAAQKAHYETLAAKNPSQQKFLKGWLKRAAWAPQ